VGFEVRGSDGRRDCFRRRIGAGGEVALGLLVNCSIRGWVGLVLGL